MKPLSNVTDPAIVKALAHPLRVSILSFLEQRTASPNEIAGELGVSLGNVSYHVRQLEKLGLIKLIKETPRRGAVEHYYRLDVRPSISDEGWASAPGFVKEALSSAVIAEIGRQVSKAAQEGGFEREDIHLSRLPLMVDDKGFQAVAREAERFVAKVRQIEQAAGKRLSRTKNDDPVVAHVALMLFEGAEEPADTQPQVRRGRSGPGRAQLASKGTKARP